MPNIVTKCILICILYTLSVMEMVRLLWLNADNYIHCAEFQVTKYLISCTELWKCLAPSQELMKNMNDNGMEKFMF